MVTELRVLVFGSDGSQLGESQYIIVPEDMPIGQFFHGLQDGILKAAVDYASSHQRLESTLA